MMFITHVRLLVMRRSIVAHVKFLSRLLTALNLPSWIATLPRVSIRRPNSRLLAGDPCEGDAKMQIT
jgi:hypothetical protein